MFYDSFALYLLGWAGNKCSRTICSEWFQVELSKWEIVGIFVQSRRAAELSGISDYYNEWEIDEEVRLIPAYSHSSLLYGQGMAN